MPRIVISGWFPAPSGLAMVTFGVIWPMSSVCLMPRAVSSCEEIACTDTGTFWMFSVRRSAVTVISSTCVPAGGAGAVWA
jgi:hypothetical protein